jgi:dihydrofolate reductase
VDGRTGRPQRQESDVRKLIVFVNTSLDGFVGGEDGAMEWMVDDEEMDHDFTTEVRTRADTILTGRATYESFEGAWPALAADPSLSPEMAAFGAWMVTTPMVVFSRGEPALGMATARLARRGVAEEVAALKAEPGGDLAAFGGAAFVQELARLGLVDEYWLKVMPVAIGRGLPLFGRLDAPLDLALAWHKVYSSGVVGLRYDVHPDPQAIVRHRYATDPQEKA